MCMFDVRWALGAGRWRLKVYFKWTFIFGFNRENYIPTVLYIMRKSKLFMHKRCSHVTRTGSLYIIYVHLYFYIIVNEREKLPGRFPGRMCILWILISLIPNSKKKTLLHCDLKTFNIFLCRFCVHSFLLNACNQFFNILFLYRWKMFY